MAAMGTSSNPTTLMSPGTETPRCAQSGDDPERHLVIERHDGRRRTVQHSVDHAEGSLEGRTGDEDLLHLQADLASALPDRSAALPRRPRRRGAAQVGQGTMAVGLEMEQRLGHGRSGAEEDGRVVTDRSIDEDRRRGTEHVELTMQTPRRDDDEAVDLPSEGLGGAHLFLPMLTSVGEEHVKLGLARRSLNRPHQRCEVGVRDVGDDHRQVAGATGDQSPGGAVGNEPQFPHRRFDSLPGLRRHSLRQIECPGHCGGVHAGARRHIEDRDSLRLPHTARPYSGRWPGRLNP